MSKKTKNAVKKQAASANKAFQKVGVISTIMEVLTQAKKSRKPVTARAILAQLTKKFPQRPEAGMFVTVRAQLSRLGSDAAGSEAARAFKVNKTHGEGREVLYSAA